MKVVFPKGEEKVMVEDVGKLVRQFKKVLLQQEEGECPCCDSRLSFTRGYQTCENKDCEMYTKIVTGEWYFDVMKENTTLDDDSLGYNGIFEGELIAEELVVKDNGDYDGSMIKIKVSASAWSDYFGKKVQIKLTE